jgi:hypothetical protein
MVGDCSLQCLKMGLQTERNKMEDIFSTRKFVVFFVVDESVILHFRKSVLIDPNFAISNHKLYIKTKVPVLN